jgi:hypothetical protein
MTTQIIVAQFNEYAAAHRTLCELIQTGVPPNDISLIAGDRSNSPDTHRDFGIIEAETDTYLPVVRRGQTVLAVRVDSAMRKKIGPMIEQYAPAKLEELATASV